MKEFSIERINAHSPYLVEKGENYSFFIRTKNDVLIRIGFSKDESIWSDGAYEMYLLNLNGKPSPRDLKLRDTVLCIVEEFFISNASILIYSFETRDNRQSLRNKLFFSWFFKNDYIKCNCIIKTSIIETIVVQKSNPQYESIINDFDRYLSYFGQKSVGAGL